MDDLDNLLSPTSTSKKPYLPRSLTHHHHHRPIKAKDKHPIVKPLWNHLADEPKCPKVVLFSTSLRGTVRTILRGFRIAVNERGVSMDAGVGGQGRGIEMEKPWVELRTGGGDAGGAGCGGWA